MPTMHDYLRLRLRGALDAIGAPTVPVDLEVSHNDHGDVATSVALRLARDTGTAPAALARRIVEAMEIDPRYVATIEVADAGFINVSYTAAFFGDRLADLASRLHAWRSHPPPPPTIIDPRRDGSPDGIPIAHLRSMVAAEAVERLRERVGVERSTNEEVRCNGEIRFSGETTDSTRPGRTEGSTLLERLGEETVRFFLLATSPRRPLSFDLDRAGARSPRNPLERLRHLHAHIAGLGRFALQHEIANESRSFELLDSSEERRVIRSLVKFPDEMARAATQGDPSIVIAGLNEIATAFEQFAAAHRIVAEPAPDIRAARLCLADLTMSALGEGLNVLGISAPDRI